MLHRALEGWVRTPRWWKGFYIAFPLGFAFVYVSTADLEYSIRWAFIQALMITAALWASEALKARLRARNAPPTDPSRPHGVDPNDLRRRR
jgi:hypothetical protein